MNDVEKALIHIARLVEALPIAGMKLDLSSQQEEVTASHGDRTFTGLHHALDHLQSFKDTMREVRQGYEVPS